MTFDPYQRRVKDEMSRNVVSIESTAPLVAAVERMEEEKVTVLPVVDASDHCIGVISAIDMVRVARSTFSQLQALAKLDRSARQQGVAALVDNDIVRMRVEDAMQFELKSVSQEMTIAEAGSRMLWTRCHHLPVVDEEQRLVGIVATLDLLAAFVKGVTPESTP